MTDWVYRALLRLLPGPLRARYGQELSTVFETLRRDAHDAPLAQTRLWLTEIGGLIRFAVRTRLTRTPRRGPAAPSSHGGYSWHPVTELRWAWRGLRQRGWSAALAVVLLAVVLAGNAVVFSVADALVFHRLPFPDAKRLVEIRSTRPGTGRSPFPILTPDLLDRWRAHDDLFTGVAGYAHGRSVFLLGSGAATQVTTADITTNLLDVLDVRPLFGRAFVDGDDRAPDGYVAILREDLARERFGRPELALGQRIDATGGALFVVGIMPAGFGFPHVGTRMWRALDPRGPLTNDLPGVVRTVARVRSTLTTAEASRAVATRASQIGAATGQSDYTAELGPFYLAERSPGILTTLSSVLLGGALCLLLAVCSNLASLELTEAVRRSQRFAIQLALGASRYSVSRIIALEGLLVIGAAFLAGILLAWLAIDLFAALVPHALSQTANAMDIDLRAAGFTASLAGLAWLLAALPPAALAGFGADLLKLLKLEEGTTASSKSGTRIRHALTAAEIAVAVCLVALGLLCARSYQQLLRLDKGFDSTGLGEISFVMAPRQGALFPDRTELVVERLASLPGVMAVPGAPPPSRPFTSSSRNLEVDGRPWTGDQIDLRPTLVRTNYFRTLRIPLRSGRYLDEQSGADDVVIPRNLAARLWPGQNPVDRQFRGDADGPWLRVVGVVENVRFDRRRLPEPGDRFQWYYQLRPPPPPAGESPVPAALRPGYTDTGGTVLYDSVTVRMASPALLPQVMQTAQEVDPNVRITFDWVDDLYARQNADTRLATQVMGSFSGLAFVVAIAGIYGVMAFLVASRTREIGIRVALGADRKDVSRLVMGSAFRLVVAGTFIGVAGAFVASRWIEGQLFGITSNDPSTYLIVAAVVASAALLATWQPARQAARVDPSVTLRAQ